MKTMTAVAALAAAPAVAQDGVGSLGITYQNTEVEAFGLEGEAESCHRYHHPAGQGF